MNGNKNSDLPDQWTLSSAVKFLSDAIIVIFTSSLVDSRKSIWNKLVHFKSLILHNIIPMFDSTTTNNGGEPSDHENMHRKWGTQIFNFVI